MQRVNDLAGGVIKSLPVPTQTKRGKTLETKMEIQSDRKIEFTFPSVRLRSGTTEKWHVFLSVRLTAKCVPRQMDPKDIRLELSRNLNTLSLVNQLE